MNKYEQLLALIPNESKELQSRWDDLTANEDTNECEEVLRPQIEWWNEIEVGDGQSMFDYLMMYHGGANEADAENIWFN